MNKRHGNDKLAIEMDAETACGLGECLTASQVFRSVPYHLVDQALATSDRTSRRLGAFPDHLVIYFVILMGLFMDLSYDHTLIVLKDGLQWLSGGLVVLKAISSAGITQARQRLTYLPLESLFYLVAKSLSTSSTPGAFAFGFRLVAIDGTTFDVEDTPNNVMGFGCPSNQQGSGAYPQVRCVALIEQATRGVLDLIFGSISTSEQYLAELLLARLQPGVLCLADRLYPSYKMCKLVLDAGGQFLWRVRKDVRLDPIKWLDDHSYLARLYLYDPSRKKKVKTEFLTVRVIRYTLEGNSEVYRLITSILDPEIAPAEQAARTYPKRWSEETFNAEIKTTLRKPRIVLRSKKPDQVIQELYGLFIAHFVVRSFMSEAASTTGIPPNVLSFTHSVFIVKRHLSEIGNFSPGAD